MSVPISRNQETLTRLLSQVLQGSFSQVVAREGWQSIKGKLDAERQQDLSHIMFTIAGLQFRVLVLLHYHSGKRAVDYLNLFQHDERGAKTKEEVDAFFSETGNQFCGEVKRYMYYQFEHLGMSTPAAMSPTTELTDIANKSLLAECHEFFCNAQEAVVGASLYAFASTPIEFEFSVDAATDVLSTGELEFF